MAYVMEDAGGKEQLSRIPLFSGELLNLVFRNITQERVHPGRSLRQILQQTPPVFRTQQLAQMTDLLLSHIAFAQPPQRRKNQTAHLACSCHFARRPPPDL